MFRWTIIVPLCRDAKEISNLLPNMRTQLFRGGDGEERVDYKFQVLGSSEESMSQDRRPSFATVT